ncbi:MAG: hypothetical protein WCA35_17595 [Kovacikia sp.]
METTNEMKQVAAQLLSAMLANPHIYASVSDEGVQGRQEQELIALAIAMAESLIAKIDGI